MMWRSLVALAFLAVPTLVSAQNAGQLLRDAQNAFQGLEFEQAARFYALALGEDAGATQAQRDTAQLYLGVSYEYAGQREDALSAFRTFVRTNPCAATPQAFGGSVVSAFDEAKNTVMAVGLCDLQEQEFEASDSISLNISVTREALVLLVLRDADGSTVGQSGNEMAEGNSTILWPLPVAAEALSDRPRQFSLILRARDQNGATGQDSVPVLISASVVDTLDHPSPLFESDFLLEIRPVSSASGDLGKGLLIGAGIAATSLLTYSSLGGEFAKAVGVGGAVSLAGIVALVRGTTSRVISENRQHNAALRSTWEAQRDSVLEVNRSRLATRQFVITPAGGER